MTYVFWFVSASQVRRECMSKLCHRYCSPMQAWTTGSGLCLCVVCCYVRGNSSSFNNNVYPELIVLLVIMRVKFCVPRAA